MQVNISGGFQEIKLSFSADREILYTNYELEIIRAETLMIMNLRGVITRNFFFKFC